MQGINPKYAFWFGVWTSILLMIASAGSTFFDGALPSWLIPPVVKWCAIFGAINSAILTAANGYSSRAPGPMINQPAPPAPPVMKLMAIFALAIGTLVMMSPAPASAEGVGRVLQNAAARNQNPGNMPLGEQSKTAGSGLTGNLNKDMQALWDKLGQATLADLQYASALADQAAKNGSNAAPVRKQCIDAIITLKKQLDGSQLKNPDGTPMPRPDPDLFTGVESFAETVDALSPTGPLFTSCAGAAQLARTSTLTLLNAIVTGVTAFSTIAPIIPAIP